MKLSELSKSTKSKIAVTVFMLFIVFGSLVLAGIIARIVKPETASTGTVTTPSSTQAPESAPATGDPR